MGRQIVAMPNDPVEHHLRELRLRQSAGSVYARQRALIRMQGLLPCPLLEASREDLLAWREGLQLSPGAISHYVSHAREFYAWAVSAGLVSGNPADELPVPPVPRLLPRPIPEDPLMNAVLLAERPIRLMLVLAAWCGLRAKELALLRRACILDRASPPFLMVAADATKGHHERIVPLCPFVVTELDLFGLPASGVIFTRGDGRPGPNAPWRISQRCNRYLHEQGIPETLHQLRHRFGTETYRATRDIRLVQELMGHASPVTTAIYTLVSPAAAAAAVAALPVPGLRIAG